MYIYSYVFYGKINKVSVFFRGGVFFIVDVFEILSDGGGGGS